MQGLNYTRAYKNGKTCEKLIFGIAGYFFEENTKNKLALVNFLAVLCDGSADKGITEQEVVYVTSQILKPMCQYSSFFI